MNNGRTGGRQNGRQTWRAFLPFCGSAVLPLLFVSCTAQRFDDLRVRELAEVRTAFDANLEAIRRRDVEAYLAGYLTTPEFLFIGPGGVERGFAPFAAARRRSGDFPDSLSADNAELTWFAPGVVHVAYPYVARQGPVAGRGWSERVFVKTADGWRIAMTGVIPGAD